MMSSHPSFSWYSGLSLLLALGTIVLFPTECQKHQVRNRATTFTLQTVREELHVRENMRVLQIAAEMYRQKSGAYANSLEALAPFFPGGENVLAGTSGQFPRNPCSNTPAIIFSNDITCESELAFRRLEEPRVFASRSGQVSYSYERLSGYAIQGYDSEGKEITSADAVLVLSNWLPIRQSFQVNNNDLYDLMKNVEVSLLMYEKRHRSLPKNASILWQFMPPRLKEEFSRLRTTLADGSFDIFDTAPLSMRKNTIEYSLVHDYRGIIRGAGADGKALIDTRTNQTIMLPQCPRIQLLSSQ